MHTLSLWPIVTVESTHLIAQLEALQCWSQLLLGCAHELAGHGCGVALVQGQTNDVPARK
jgi:hypothetical protein